MTRFNHIASFALLLALMAPSAAQAQDPTVTRRKPNVMIIVDTSGSMEYKTGSDSYPSCDPLGPATNNERSRWIEVVEVLTGAFPDTGYSCESIDRTNNATFDSEYQLPGGLLPPDTNYRNPHHRPISNGCMKIPDNTTAHLDGNPFNWVGPNQVQFANRATACTNFTQGIGFVDSYNELVRFGLMTYDSLPDPATGFNTVAPFAADYEAGARGAWSYYGSEAPAAGHPADCLSDQDLEVGVRNGSAPASEGKMIYFGDPNLTNIQDRARHDRLQDVLLVTRPYGATPINGTLHDARHFFREDTTFEPTVATTSSGDSIYGTSGSNLKLSPLYDPYVACGCREQHIILITDGEPNLDMRPHCDAPGTPSGVCPFPDTPAEILTDLKTDSGATAGCNTPSPGSHDREIITHVVGFSTGTYDSGARDCEDLPSDTANWNPATESCFTTSDTDTDLNVCCTLHELAAAGASNTVPVPADPNYKRPHIAPDVATLQAALGDIMTQITGARASGTQPVQSPGVGLTDNTSAGFRLLTSYSSDTGNSGLWRGTIERVRWDCTSGSPVLAEKDPAEGDDFAFNVANNMSDREFITFVPNGNASRSVRPWLTADGGDLVGNVGGTTVEGNISALVSGVSPEAMELDLVGYASNPACGADADTGAPAAASAAACAERILRWTAGYDSGSGRNRCATPSDDSCSVIADIRHSTPVIVNRPTAPVDDKTYDTYASDPDYGQRPMMAYVSSNDGFLHGFGVSQNAGTPGSNIADSDAKNNEYFAFVPPAILPQLKSQYPENPSKLLDGVGVVQEVVAMGPSASAGYKYTLSRTANASTLGSNTWRTILVQSFGGEQPGYFAMDITEPGRPSDSGTEGAQFLWQLTTTASGSPLFGRGGTPLITTVSIGTEEVAVAVLPGGDGTGPTGSTCDRSNSNVTTPGSDTFYNSNTGTNFSGLDFEPREQVNCYTDVAARSLTIVRLDNGEIIRMFRRNDSSAPPEIPGYNPVNSSGSVLGTTSGDDPFLDSPITGEPAAFPAGVGMVSDRIFVGDRDGTLWRVDVSKHDPGDWKMELFFDAYAEEAPLAGKPIVTAPTLSVDQRGQITVNFATGDQDTSGTSGDINYVYSLTEVEDSSISSGFYARVNWYDELGGGAHVLGAMSLLEGVLYYSTVDPSSGNANVCNPAPGSIWGVHYLLPEGTGSPVDGGLASLVVDDGSSSPPAFQSRTVGQLIDAASGSTGADETTVFGVSLDYVPTCVAPSATPADTLIDGGRTKVESPTSSKLQLSFQIGIADDTSTSSLGFTTGFEVVNLSAPKTASRILSWAAILD